MCVRARACVFWEDSFPQTLNKHTPRFDVEVAALTVKSVEVTVAEAVRDETQPLIDYVTESCDIRAFFRGA